MTLEIALEFGQTLCIGSTVVVKIEKGRNCSVRFAVNAPRHIAIYREEKPHGKLATPKQALPI